MDPKALAGLDPKLRETYEKVMGTSTSPANRITGSGPATPTSPPPADKNRPPADKPSSTPHFPSPMTSIPPPNPSTTPDNPPSNTIQPPVQVSNLDATQPIPTNTTLPSTQKSAIQPGKPMQPLPSPTSINKTIKSSNQSSPLIRVLYIFASIIFFAVYIIFWLKIFK
ncbi:hypothetical protein KKE68_04190, partial [Patescibacteria group bacterium]|nr:hypothetical protein [Patescibacteria group bacterium]